MSALASGLSPAVCMSALASILAGYVHTCWSAHLACSCMSQTGRQADMLQAEADMLRAEACRQAGMLQAEADMLWAEACRQAGMLQAEAGRQAGRHAAG